MLVRSATYSGTTAPRATSLAHRQVTESKTAGEPPVACSSQLGPRRRAPADQQQPGERAQMDCGAAAGSDRRPGYWLNRPPPSTRSASATSRAAAQAWSAHRDQRRALPPALSLDRKAPATAARAATAYGLMVVKRSTRLGDLQAAIAGRNS